MSQLEARQVQALPLPSQSEGDFTFCPLCSVFTGAFLIQGLGFAFHVQAVQTGLAAPGELVLIHHGKAPSWTRTQLLKFRASQKLAYKSMGALLRDPGAFSQGI